MRTQVSTGADVESKIAMLNGTRDRLIEQLREVDEQLRKLSYAQRLRGRDGC